MKNRFLNSVIVVFCIVVCFVCFSSCFAEEKDRLVICSFSPELQMLIDKYYKPNHPDFDYEYVTYPIDNETYHKEIV